MTNGQWGQCFSVLLRILIRFLGQTSKLCTPCLSVWLRYLNFARLWRDTAHFYFLKQ